MNIDPNKKRDPFEDSPNAPLSKKYKLDAVESIVCDSLNGTDSTNLEWTHRLSQKGLELQFAPLHIQNDPDLVITAIKQNPLAIRFASKELKNSVKVVLEAVKQDGMTLYFASDELKDYYKVVINAVIQNSHALCFASEKLKACSVICEFVALNNPNAYINFGSYRVYLDHSKPKIQDWKQRIHDYWNWDWRNYDDKLYELKESFKIVKIDDRERALRSIEHTSRDHIGNTMKKDFELCLEACKRNPYYFNHIPPELENSLDFARKAIEANNDLVKYIPRKFLGDKEVILGFLKSLADYDLRLSTTFLGKLNLGNDIEFLKECLALCGSILEFAPQVWKNNRELVLQAVQTKGRALQYASETLKNDKELALAAIETHPENFKYISKSLQSDKDILNAIQKKPFIAYRHWPRYLQKDKNLFLKIVSDDYRCYTDWLNCEFMKDPTIVRAALANDIKQIMKKFQETLKEINFEEENSGFIHEFLDKTHIVPDCFNDLLTKRDFFYELITMQGWLIKFASETMRGDKELCLTAVARSGRSLQYCSENMRDNEEVVREALKEDIRALKSASRRLSKDFQLILEGAKMNSGKRIAYALLHDHQLMIEVVMQLPDEKQRAVLETLKIINAPYFLEVKSALIGWRALTKLKTMADIFFW